MAKKKVVLKPLWRSLPKVPKKPIVDDDGDEYVPGFNGDISQSPHYVTDGRLLLLKSAIEPSAAALIFADPDRAEAKYATEKAIGKVWKAAEDRVEESAEFIGSWDSVSRSSPVVFVRDASGRVMTLSAYIFAFAVKVLRPDRVTVSAGWDALNPYAPLAFWRDGNRVGLLASQRLNVLEHFPLLDFSGEPIELKAAR